MDRDLSQSVITKQKRKKLIIISSAVIGFIFFLLSFRMIITPTLDAKRIRTAIAEIGDVESTINASGIIVPEYEHIIISPVNSKILEVKHRAGESVKKGDRILKIYRETIQNDYNKALDEYELKKNRIEKKKLDVKRTINRLKTEYEIKSLKVESLEADLEREKKLLKIGAATTVTVAKAKLMLDISRKELTLQAAQIKNQEKTLEADLKELDLEVKIQERIKNELAIKLEDSKIEAQNDGVLTMVKNEIGSNINAGDIIAKLADLNTYKVEASISDMFADKIFAGQKAKVRINGKDLYGEIKNISPAVENNLIKFEVKLENKQSKLLRPNLRSEVFVLLDVVKNVVRVKNGPFFRGTANQKIYVIKNGIAYDAKAKFGVSNFDYIEIKSGIKEGDEVIISSMNDYFHMDEIEINN